MLISDLTFEAFEVLLQKEEIVFVDFWAEWCVPCQTFSTAYEEIASKYPNVCFAKVDIQTQEALAQILHIRSIPHLMVFKSGIAIYSESGSIPAAVLNDLVLQAIDTDVSQIKQAIAQEEI